MSEPKRYHLEMQKADDGDWVLYEDYDRLKAEVERLTLENSQYEEHHKYGQNVIASLREEVERLTKAGDAFVLLLEDEGYDMESIREVDGWLAAKEGKPRA